MRGQSIKWGILPKDLASGSQDCEEEMAGAHTEEAHNKHNQALSDKPWGGTWGWLGHTLRKPPTGLARQAVRCNLGMAGAHTQEVPQQA
jgi:hypothetical protein